MTKFGRLTKGEVQRALESVQALLSMRTLISLEPVVVTRLIGLGVDLEAELTDRRRIDREGRMAAMAGEAQS